MTVYFTFSPIHCAQIIIPRPYVQFIVIFETPTLLKEETTFIFSLSVDYKHRTTQM
jgi:hypothetical protein